MNKAFEKYITATVNKIDCSNDIKSDLSEELMNHLEESYETLINDGYSKEVAEKEALRRFGSAEKIGNEISQAMYPYQKELLMTLAISSFIYSFIVYLIQLFNEGDAHIFWLIISVSMSTVLLLFIFHIIKQDGKRLLNTALVIHTIIYLFGLGLALGTEHFLTAMLAVYSILIMLLSITLIYLNVIFHWEMSTLKKGFHIFNMSVGLLIIGVNLYFIGLFLIFSEVTLKAFLLFLPTVLWILTYIVQIAFVNRKSVKLGIVIAFIPLLLVASVFLFIIWTFLF